MFSNDINIKQIEKLLYSILKKQCTTDNERKKLKGFINRAIDEIVKDGEILSKNDFDQKLQLNMKQMKNQAEKLKEYITVRGLRDLSNLTQEELQEVIKTALETVTKDPNYKEITEKLEKNPNFISGLKKDFREFLDSEETSKKGLSSLVLILFILSTAVGKSVKFIIRAITNLEKEVVSLMKNTIDVTRKSNLKKFLKQENSPFNIIYYTIGENNIDFLEEYLLNNNGKFSKPKLKDLKEAFRKIGKEVKDQKGNLIGYEIPYYDTSSMRSEIVTLYDLNRLVEKGKSSFREDEKIFKQLLNKFTALLFYEKNIDIKNEIDKERDNERKGRGLISYSSDLYSTPGKFNSFLGRFSKYFDEEKCHSTKKFLQKYIELDDNSAQQLQDKSNGIIGGLHLFLNDLRNKEDIFRNDLSLVFNQLKDLNVKQIEEMSNEISNLIVGQQNKNSPSILYANRKTNLDKVLEQSNSGGINLDFVSKYLLDDGKFSKSKLKDFTEAFKKVGRGYEEGGIIDYKITYKDKDTEKEDTINLNDINILVKKGESTFIGDKKDFEKLLGKFSHLMSKKNQDILSDINIELDIHQRKKEKLIGYGSALYFSVINGIDSFLSDFDEEKRHIVERLFKTYIELDDYNAQSLASLSEEKVGVIYHILKQLRQANTQDELKGNLKSIINQFKGLSVNKIEKMNEEVSDLIKEQRITNQELTLFTTQKSNLEKEINSLDKRGLDFFRRYNVLDNNKFNESEFKYLKKVFRKIGKEIRDKKENIIDYKILYKNPRLGEENTIKSSDVEKFKELANSTSILNKKELKILLDKFTHLMSEENQDVILNIDKKMFGKNKSRMPINGSVRSYSQPVDLLSFLGDFDKKKHVVISEFLTEYSKLDKNSLSTFQDFTVYKAVGSIVINLLGEVRESYNFMKKHDLDALSREFASLSVNKIEEMNKEMSNLIEKQNKPSSNILSSNTESSFSKDSSRTM